MVHSFNKDWCLQMADKERGLDVSAGRPPVLSAFDVDAIKADKEFWLLHGGPDLGFSDEAEVPMPPVRVAEPVRAPLVERDEFVAVVAGKTGFTSHCVKLVMETMFEALEREILHGHSVRLVNFGTVHGSKESFMVFRSASRISRSDIVPAFIIEKTGKAV